MFIKKLIYAVSSIFIMTTSVLANDIYITQSGDTLDLDIVQDGTDNEFGDATTGVALTGDTMEFSITQTGYNNDIAATINGDFYTGTWVFTGNYNVVDLNCDGAVGANCDDVTLNITTTGDENDYTFSIGSADDAEDSTIAFTVTGDNNIIDTTVDGQKSAITVTLNNSTSLATTSADSDEGVAVTIDSANSAATHGNVITLGITGGGSTYDITQSGVNDNKVVATFNGDSHDVDITQSD